MVAEEKSNILIVEDDLDLAEMLNSYFRVQGYEVLTAAWGEDAVRITRETSLDLVILDILLPDIDGYSVCERIRENRATANLPVIFLTERSHRMDKLAGLELGVVDYITKPFDIQELRLRVRNSLERAKLSSQVNPVTNTAKGYVTDQYLGDLVAKKDETYQWAVLSVHFEGLDAFREQYSFMAAEDVLRAVTLMVNNAVRDETSKGKKAFVGHFNENDFVIIAQASQAEAIKQNIEVRLENSLDYFYPLKDRDKLASLPEEDRLRINVGITRYSDDSFGELDGLKKAILKARDMKA